MQYKVIFSIRGIVGGVDVFSERLAEQLISRNIPSRILVRKHTWEERYGLPLQGKVPTDQFAIRKGDTWPMRWKRLIQYLEGQAPCIYLPGYDFEFSGIAPKLSQSVATIGIVHSDDPWHYDQVIRLGKHFDAVVGVSDAIMDHVRTLPSPPARSYKIPYGVPVPSSPAHRISEAGTPLRIVYSGRLMQHQKRIFDLPKIFSKLQEQKVPVRVTILGDGLDGRELEKQCAPFLSAGTVKFAGSLPNQQVLELFRNHDVVLLTSDYEGMPIALMEAMACGCVPVATDIRSGVPELISDGENGFIVRIGDISGFANSLQILQSDLRLRQQMSQNSYERMLRNFSLEKMADAYKDLFDRVMYERITNTNHRIKGPVVVPPWIKLSWKDKLPAPVRRILKIPGKIARQFRDVKKISKQ